MIGPVPSACNKYMGWYEKERKNVRTYYRVQRMLCKLWEAPAWTAKRYEKLSSLKKNAKVLPTGMSFVHPKEEEIKEWVLTTVINILNVLSSPSPTHSRWHYVLQRRNCTRPKTTRSFRSGEALKPDLLYERKVPKAKWRVASVPWGWTGREAIGVVMRIGQVCRERF